MQACRARHIPIIFDEVMTGLYRVGSVTAASLLREVPDIACYAKLMTAGVVPGAATLATEKVFDAFQRESKVRGRAIQGLGQHDVSIRRTTCPTQGLLSR